MFTRQPYTIPAAGEFLKIDAKGQAVIIENMPIYDTPEDVPLFHYNSKSNRGQAMFPLSTYGFDLCEEFGSIYLQGTDASAGDTVWLWINDQYLETKINIVFNAQFETTPGETDVIACDDTSKSIPAISLPNADDQMPKKVYISASGASGVADGGIYYSFTRAAGRTNNSHFLANDQDPIPIEGLNWIEALRFTAGTPGETPNLVYTLEY